MKFLFLAQRLIGLNFHCRSRIVVVPGTDHPFQFFQMLVVRRRRLFLFNLRDPVEQPLAVAWLSRERR